MSLFKMHKSAIVIVDDEEEDDLGVSQHGASEVLEVNNSNKLLRSAEATRSMTKFLSLTDASPSLADPDPPVYSSHEPLSESPSPVCIRNGRFEEVQPPSTPQVQCSSRSTSRTISSSSSISPHPLPSMMARGTASSPFDLTNYDKVISVDDKPARAHDLVQPEANLPIDLTNDDEKISRLLRQSVLCPNPEPNRKRTAVSATINLTDDAEVFVNDDDEGFVCSGSRSASPHDQRFYMNNRVLIDLDDYEDSDEADLARPSPESHPRRGSNAIPRRNPSISLPLKVIDECNYNQFKLRRNKTVELVDGDFLVIQKIVANSITGEIKLIGNRVQRQKDLNGMLARVVNEVALCFEVDLDDLRDPKEQAVVELPLSQVEKLRSVRITNHLPENFRHTNPAELRDMAVALAEGGLTVRWKYTTSFVSAAERQRNSVRKKEWALERIKPVEASANCSVAEDSLRLEWRGETVLGGAYLPKPISKVLSESQSLAGSRNQPIQLDYQDWPILTSERKRKRDDEFLVSKQARMGSRGDAAEARRRSFVITPPAAQVSSKMTSAVIDLCIDDHPKVRRASRLPQAIDLSGSDLAAPPPSGEIIQSPSAPSGPKTRAQSQKYTFGDAFCGAGGTTRGAEMAGAKVVWGFDKDEVACKTWRKNFSGADCYQMEAFEFNCLFRDASAVKVDILHMSPPCQFFSPAHTRVGPNDETNSASLFAVLETIKRVRPRVVTLEQTFGLLERVESRMYFNGLVHMFTDANFSIRWRLVPLQEWGLPARRTRLVMIASCPGEILPRMPLATHSENGGNGFKPFATVNQTISGLGPNPHLDRPFKYFTQPQIDNSQDKKCPIRPYDGDKYLPKAITCSGGGNWHPNGERDFTLKEYAALQGFPPIHRFSGSDTAVKKQIGNAVPPIIAKVLFESIIKDLIEADGIIDDGCIYIE